MNAAPCMIVEVAAELLMVDRRTRDGITGPLSSGSRTVDITCGLAPGHFFQTPRCRKKVLSRDPLTNAAWSLESSDDHADRVAFTTAQRA